MKCMFTVTTAVQTHVNDIPPGGTNGGCEYLGIYMYMKMLIKDKIKKNIIICKNRPLFKYIPTTTAGKHITKVTTMCC